MSALLRSLPGVGGFLALALVTLYVYAMAGWRRTTTPTATAGRTNWTGSRSASAWTICAR